MTIPGSCPDTGHLRRSPIWSGVHAELPMGLVLLALICFFLLPTMPARLLGRDEAIYSYFAQRASRHFLLYRDFWDVHFPGLYYLYAISFHIPPHGMATVRWLHLLFLCAGVLGFRLLLQRLNVRPAFARIGMLAYGLFACSPALEGEIANTEAFSLPLVFAALYLSLPGRGGADPRAGGDSSAGRDFAAGLALGVASLFKQSALLLLLVPVISTTVGENGRPLRIREGLRRLPALAAGWLIPVGGAVAVLAAHGALREFFSCAVFYVLFQRNHSLGLLPQIGNSLRLGTILFHAHPFLIASALAGLGILVRGAPPAPRSATRWMTVWLALAAALAFGGGRDYPHYLQMIVPPLCGLGALALQVSWDERRHARAGGLALVLLLSGLIILDAGDTIRSGFSRYRRSGSSLDDRFASEDARVGAYLRARTRPEERIFVWGANPAVYIYADRSAPTRFVGLMAVVGANVDRPGRRDIPGAMDELERDLRAYPPAYVVVVERLRTYDLRQPHLQWLQTILDEDYDAETRFDDFTLYRRRSSGPPGRSAQ